MCTWQFSSWCLMPLLILHQRAYLAYYCSLCLSCLVLLLYRVIEKKKFVCFIGHLMVDQIAKKCNVMCDIMKHMLLRLVEYINKYWRWPELLFVTKEKAKKYIHKTIWLYKQFIDLWLQDHQWPYWPKSDLSVLLQCQWCPQMTNLHTLLWTQKI